MNAGDVVKYAKPANAAEAALLFVVIEDRGDRLLVEALGTGLPIPGQTCFATSEYELVPPGSTRHLIAEMFSALAVAKRDPNRARRDVANDRLFQIYAEMARRQKAGDADANASFDFGAL